MPLQDARPLPRERSLADERLREDDPERVEVGSPVDVAVPLDLLRRHVLRRPEKLRRARQARAPLGPREAEVGELDVAALVEEQVLGLQVAVDEPGRVHRLEGARDLGADDGRLAPRKTAFLAQTLPERASRHELEGEIGRARDHSRVQHSCHMGVHDGARRASLALEARHERRVRPRPIEHLERDPGPRP